jgi:hypothetical protein
VNGTADLNFNTTIRDDQTVCPKPRPPRQPVFIRLVRRIPAQRFPCASRWSVMYLFPLTDELSFHQSPRIGLNATNFAELTSLQKYFFLTFPLIEPKGCSFESRSGVHWD